MPQYRHYSDHYSRIKLLFEIHRKKSSNVTPSLKELGLFIHVKVAQASAQINSVTDGTPLAPIGYTSS